MPKSSSHAPRLEILYLPIFLVPCYLELVHIVFFFDLFYFTFGCRRPKDQELAGVLASDLDKI
ncbi:MAG: hypothetical protein ACXAC5_03910 [Promethearchaeota archaeon]